ncbi:hypothetical protein TWF730_009610 [Orbilia blumenaviensis]|uniref:Uncharacterized protein n=1 Tax=Orbilia blumenaviensis TaxID=1796055 RepID=A0AAV9UTP2_9PEZI
MSHQFDFTKTTTDEIAAEVAKIAAEVSKDLEMKESERKGIKEEKEKFLRDEYGKIVLPKTSRRRM